MGCKDYDVVEITAFVEVGAFQWAFSTPELHCCLGASMVYEDIECAFSKPGFGLKYSLGDNRIWNDNEVWFFQLREAGFFSNIVLPEEFFATWEHHVSTKQ
jgi:hypothetical protein